jgi:hypothetical protein
MVVRDWDRVYSSDASLEKISDIYLSGSARQDIPGVDEIPGEQDTFNAFNDRGDWDNFIPMQRTGGLFNAGTTIWQPIPSGIYLDGFFNPDIFLGPYY